MTTPNEREAPSATLKALLVIAWPVVLARSSQAVVGFCDALMTAPLGEQSLAAVTTGSINVFSLSILPMGLVFIVQSFAAQLHGRGDPVSARRYGYYGVFLALAAGALGVLAIPLLPWVLGAFDYEAAVESEMTQYMSIRLLGVGAFIATEALGNWFSGLGRTRLHMGAGLVAMVVNVALNYALIEGNWGAPALGVTGAAAASVIAGCVAFAYLAIMFVRERQPGELKTLSRRELRRVLRFGLPNGFSWFFEFAALAVYINLVVARLGTTILAAMMVVFSVNSVSFMPAFGIASSGAILVGQAIGARRHDLVSRVVRLTMKTTVVWQCSVGVLYLLLPTAIMGLFAPDSPSSPQLVVVGGTLLALSAGWQFFDAVGLTLAEALRAAGDTSWCLWARILIAWLVFTPLSILTVVVLGGGYVVAMINIIVYVALLGIALTMRFVRGRWREIELLGSVDVWN